MISLRPPAPAALLAATSLAFAAPAVPALRAAPKVIVISLDGATPRLVEDYLARGVLPADRGLGLLRREGVRARQTVTVSPSLTAVSHIALATGSTAAANDIVGNSFSLLASPFGTTVSGFSAPIGGYALTGATASPSASPTAEPVWVRLRAAGKTVVCATFPGADGLNVTVPGVTNSPVVEPAIPRRTVDYTLPFGEFGGVSGRGFSLTTTDFTPAPAATVTALTAAGRRSFSPVQQKTTALETFSVNGVSYTLNVAALDTTDDGRANYDTLVIFAAAQGIPAGPFALPSTGPAFLATAAGAATAPFYLEGSPRKAGVFFYLTALAGDLSTVRFIRSSANDIPRNAPVLATVDDVNNHVGFWAAQPDFRFPERLVPTVANFPDSELEFVYQEQVRTWTDYQARVAERAIGQNPNADLVMVYFEQPDGSEHQFLLTDPRQPTNPLDPNSINEGQDQAKVARYARYVENAYRAANEGVARVIAAAGQDANGRPLSNVLVVSDHGFETFHTAVNMNALLRANGFDPTKVNAVTSGPAVNLYINLAGRSPGGNVSPTEYLDLQRRLVDLLNGLQDANPNYLRPGSVARSYPVFTSAVARPSSGDPADPNLGRGRNSVVGQDSGDVYALLAPGFNFDGTQSPVVPRRGDPASANPVFSLPNFYGAHGYDPALVNLSAIFYAAGPDVGRGTLPFTRNIDVAPTVSALLGVAPAPTVQGSALTLNQPAVSITAGEGGFFLRRAAGPAADLTVRLRAAGTAAPGQDYLALGGEVVIPADEEAVFLPVVPGASLPAGTSRTVKLILLPDAAYTVAGSDRAKLKLTGGG